MTVSASRVQYIWSPILGWALLTCSASLAVAQVGVAVPGVSDTPVTSSDQTTSAPGDQTGGTSTPSTAGGLSPIVTPAPVARPNTFGDIALPAGTTVANPSTQLIPGLSDTLGGAATSIYGGGANGISLAGFSGGGAPGGDELGISVGSFRLYPAIDITTGADNNVFATNNVGTATTTPTTTPTLSLSTVVAPSLALRSDWLNHSINFMLGGGFGFYASAPTQNYQNYFLIVDGRIDVREDMALAYSFGYRRATEALGTANVAFAQAPTVAESFPVTLSLTKKFNRFSVEGGGGATRLWFQDHSTITSGGLDALSRNRNAYEEHLRFGYELTEDVTLFITPSITQTRYDLNPDTLGQTRDSSTAALGLGASWVINPTSTIFGNIGYASSSGAMGSTSAITFALGGAWNGYTPLSIRPSLSRGITETALSAYRNTVTTTLGVEYSYQVFDEFALVGGFSYSLSDYQPADPGTLGTAPPAGARQDAFARGSIGFLWNPRPQFSIGPIFEYTQGSSSDPTGPAYTRQLLSIRLSARR